MKKYTWEFYFHGYGETEDEAYWNMLETVDFTGRDDPVEVIEVDPETKNPIKE